jgi:hypothetical protein
VDRRLLDHERSLRELDLKRGVVEVARRPPLEASRERFVDASVEPDEVPARAERQPAAATDVEIVMIAVFMMAR